MYWEHNPIGNTKCVPVCVSLPANGELKVKDNL